MLPSTFYQTKKNWLNEGVYLEILLELQIQLGQKITGPTRGVSTQWLLQAYLCIELGNQRRSIRYLVRSVTIGVFKHPKMGWMKLARHLHGMTHLVFLLTFKSGCGIPNDGPAAGPKSAVTRAVQGAMTENFHLKLGAMENPRISNMSRYCRIHLLSSKTDYASSVLKRSMPCTCGQRLIAHVLQLFTLKYFVINKYRISWYYTSSSRASRGRKFHKKKELYSKERICL